MEKEISLGFILGTIVCVVKKLFKYALMGAIAGFLFGYLNMIM